MRRPCLLLVLTLAALLGSCNVVPSLSATPRLGTLELDGDLSISSSGSSASGDMEDLGFDDDGAVFEPRVDLAWGPIDLIATAYDAAYAGSGTADVTFDLGGVTINTGEDVDSELDLRGLALLATWDLVPTDFVDVGLGLGVQALDIDAAMTSQTSGDTIETDESVPFPVVAARAAVQISDLTISAVGSGVSVETNDVDATYYDVDLMASWTFERFLGFHGALVAGWRQIALDAEYDDDGSDVVLDFSISGPFVGLTLGI